jgi:integrase
LVRKSDPIKKVTLQDGSTRYRFVIDIGRKPDGSRQQKTYTYETLTKAKAERANIIAEKAKGTFVAPTNLTLDAHLTAWLAGKRKLRAGTARTYTDALKTVRERLGTVPLQKLTKAHLDELVTWMLKHGRRVGNKQSQGLSPRTVNYMLMVLGQAIEDAMKQGLVVRNVARLVERVSETKNEMQTWTAEQAAEFLAYVSDDRLYAAWLLSLYGLRRGEICGLRWSRVDLDGIRAHELGLPSDTPSITVFKSRVSVAGVVHEEDPKTKRSERTLPLDETLVKALRALKAKQAAEKLAAGPGYGKTDLLVVDELGVPFKPDRYSNTFERLAKQAGLPVIRLHDTRHTTATLMHLRGVKTAVISAWLGHASADFTMRTYVHSQSTELAGASTTLRGALTGS